MAWEFSFLEKKIILGELFLYEMTEKWLFYCKLLFVMKQ